MIETLRIARDIPGVEPETVFMLGNLAVKNSTLMTLAILVLSILLVLTVTRRPNLIPKKAQNTFEYLYEGMVDLVAQITGSKKYTDFLFPLIGSIFLYIGIANLITLIPGVNSFSYNGVPLFRTATADFNTTFGLALAMIVLIQFASLKQIGLFGYLGKFFKFKGIYRGFKKGVGEGFVAIIEFFIGLLDIISELAKIVSLSLRLFGNIYAGEVLAVIILGALAYGLPSSWLALNLLFGVVQAIVFGSLVTAYYMLAVETEEASD